MALENPAAGLLLCGAWGVPQIQSVDGSPADSFVLEFGREIDVVSGNLADAKCLRGFLGERLYEQVIGPFLMGVMFCVQGWMKLRKIKC